MIDFKRLELFDALKLVSYELCSKEIHDTIRDQALEEAARVAYLAIGEGPQAAAKASDIEKAIRALKGKP